MLTITCDEPDARIDAWLARKIPGCSRNAAQNMIASGLVRVNGAPVAKNHRAKTGDEVRVEAPEPEPPGVAGQDIGLDVVYEDAYIIVVDKPQGMVVHPGSGNRDGTLANALVHHCAGGLSDVGGAARPGIVHRLDKDTSGLIVAAKTNEAHARLAAEFSGRRVRKIYNAIVLGHVEHDSGRIDMPVGRDAADRKKMAVRESGGRQAVTLFKVVRRLPCGCTWLELELLTGRTHQIRVHLAQIGHPVAFDPVYARGRHGIRCPGPASCALSGVDNPGPASCALSGVNNPSPASPTLTGVNNPGPASCALSGAYSPVGSGALPPPGGNPPSRQFSGQLLHSTVLEFAHPATGERMAFASPLPQYFPQHAK